MRLAANSKGACGFIYHKNDAFGFLSQYHEGVLRIVPLKITERIGLVSYRLRLPEELNDGHGMFHVSNLKKCLADQTLHMPLEEIQIDDKLNFVEEPVEILEREFEKLKRSRIPIVKDYPVSRLAEIFQQEIVRLHGTPSAIVSDRDPRFASRFWKGLQKAWETRLKFSTAFHPQTDGQTERTTQTLEDMLRSCALEKCRAPICWDQSYADKHRKSLEFQPGDRVFLKVSPTRGVRRFGIKDKLSPCFIGPFEILDHVGEIRADLSYVEEPEAILDHQDRVMRNKTIPLVKILWRNHPAREATWETEESI
nr:putative reverse transcriptase domain-containing protein [Tanacetum cinerariifolium]